MMQADTTLGGGASTAYDSVWAAAEAVQQSNGFEQVMLAQDKLYVVLAVVLIIWIGLIVFVLRTDKKLSSLERAIDEGIASQGSEPPHAQ